MQYKSVNTTQVKPHPINRKIYGDTYDPELLQSIKSLGILTPLRISKKNEVISGHRRHQVALELGITEIPVVYSEESDDLLIQREIIESNKQREKTTEVKAREYKALKEIEEILAKQRQAENAKRNQPQAQNVANLPPLENTGKSRDKAAEHVGMKPKTAENASVVIDTINDLTDAGQDDQAQELADTLNKSVNGAYKKAKEIKANAPPKKDYKPQFNQTNDNIKWAKWTWNPVTGCEHDCGYCYARDIAKRFYDHGFEPHYYPERLDAPQNTKLPIRTDAGWQNVFVSSMGDLFGEWVPQEWIDTVLDAVRDAQQWNFIFLTKNPKRLIDIDWPVNSIVGTTVDKQDRVDDAVSAFASLKTQPMGTFLSCEPLLERLDFYGRVDLFDWVIIGGLSRSTGGPGWQPPFEWVESLHNQARTAGCHIFWKDNLTCKPQEYPEWLKD